ncbi:hypothetical protein D3C72_2237100 [compost metagenome]
MVSTLKTIGVFLLDIKGDFGIAISTRVPEFISPRYRKEPYIGIFPFGVTRFVISIYKVFRRSAISAPFIFIDQSISIQIGEEEGASPTA